MLSVAKNMVSEKNISDCCFCSKQVYTCRDLQDNLKNHNEQIIHSEELLLQSHINDIDTGRKEIMDYNIATTNIFTNLVETSMQPFVKERVELKRDKKEEDVKHSLIDRNNYNEYFKDFLESFKDAPSENSKYHEVAAKMISNNYNVFQVSLKDILKFNTDLGKFVGAQYGSLETEITGLIEDFIEGLNLGVLDHGLHFLLIGQKTK